MKSLCTVAALFAAVLLAGAENLLPPLTLNPSTGMPGNWNPSRKSSVGIAKTDSGSIAMQSVMRQGDPKALWISYLPMLKSGVFYEITIRAKAASTASMTIYVESSKPKWQTYGDKYTVTGEWKNYTFRFRFEPFQGSPYLAVRLNAPGTLIFAPVSLTVYTPPLLVNADFSRVDAKGTPIGWGISSKAAAKVVTLEKGAKGLSISGSGAGVHAIQSGLPFKAGKTYRLTLRVKGQQGTVARAYFECSKPWCTISQRVICNGSWQTLKVDACFKELVNRPYLVLGLIGKGGEATFADLTVTEVAATTVANGNFESGSALWELTGGAAVVKTAGERKNVLEINSVKKKSSAVQKGIFLKGGQRYTITYDVQGGSDRRYTDSQNATWFRVGFCVNGKPLPGCEIWQDSFSGWHHKSASFIPAKDVVADLVCELKDPGTARFDNIMLEKGGLELPPVQLVLKNPVAFRNRLHLDLPGCRNEVAGTVYLNIPGVRSATVRFNGESKTVAAGKSFAFPVGKPGTYTLTVEAPKAKPLNRTITVLKGKVPAIAFRDDNVMLLDGTPFFPIACWRIHGPLSYHEKIRRVAKSHFNLVRAAEMTELNAAASEGLYTIVSVIENLPPIKDAALKKNWQEYYVSSLLQRARHPSLLGYMICDEPAWRGVPAAPIVEAYNFIRSAEPDHFIWLNEAPRGSIDKVRPFAEACDLYGVDIYPVPAPNSHSGLEDKMMTSVGRYTDICREVTFDGKPVVMTLQGFSWGALTKRKEHIYPTHEENRFMAYNAITHGAVGLAYYGICEGEEKWDFVELLGKTLDEITKLAPALTARTVTPSALSANAPAIRILHKRLNGVNYYIAVNETGKKCTVQLKGTGKLTVLFENRTVNGSDVFAPWGVHVYTDGKGLPKPYKYRDLRHISATPEEKTPQNFYNASWIWYPKASTVAGSRIFLRRSFRLAELPAKAELFATGDDSFQAAVNGKTVIEHHSSRSYSVFSRADVTKLMKKGDNLLFVKAMDGGQPPCGFIYVLQLTGKDGKVTRIFSDRNTLAAKVSAPGDWKPAEELGKLGCAPWMNIVQILPAETETIGKKGFPF